MRKCGLVLGGVSARRPHVRRPPPVNEVASPFATGMVQMPRRFSPAGGSMKRAREGGYILVN